MERPLSRQHAASGYPGYNSISLHEPIQAKCQGGLWSVSVVRKNDVR